MSFGFGAAMSGANCVPLGTRKRRGDHTGNDPGLEQNGESLLSDDNTDSGFSAENTQRYRDTEDGGERERRGRRCSDGRSRHRHGKRSSRSRSRDRDRSARRKRRSRSRSKSNDDRRRRSQERDRRQHSSREEDEWVEKDQSGNDSNKWDCNRTYNAQGPNGSFSSFGYGEDSLNDSHMASFSTQPGTPGSQGSNEGKRKRKSRWGTETEKAFVPGMPTMLPSSLTEEQRQAYLLQLQIEEITRNLRSAEYGIPDNPEERSPSPEPLYDSHGKRLNTREVRAKAKLENKRHNLIQDMLRFNPIYKPPPDYKPPSARLTAKVWIPQDNNPQINFVGLLIGPRGLTLKQLETETGARIIIRGKGSVKDGKVAKKEGPLPGEDEPLHAYIQATDQAAVERAVKKIEDTIRQAVEIPEAENEFRKEQLKQLALIQGTLRSDQLALVSLNRCSNCGADTHKSWECPDRPNVTANVFCTACGAAGHIAKDCKNPRPGGAAGSSALDDEYSALMAELGEGADNRNIDLGPVGLGIPPNTRPIIRVNLTRPRPQPLMSVNVPLQVRPPITSPAGPVGPFPPIPPPWVGTPGMPTVPVPPVPQWPWGTSGPMPPPPPPPPSTSPDGTASNSDNTSTSQSSMSLPPMPTWMTFGAGGTGMPPPPPPPMFPVMAPPPPPPLPTSCSSTFEGHVNNVGSEQQNSEQQIANFLAGLYDNQ